MMKNLKKWVVSGLVVVTAASVLAGCFVETQQPRRHRTVYVR